MVYHLYFFEIVVFTFLVQIKMYHGFVPHHPSCGSKITADFLACQGNSLILTIISGISPN